MPKKTLYADRDELTAFLASSELPLGPQDTVYMHIHD